MAYVCFIVDAFSRRIVGWRVASNMRTEMVLDALEMARRSRGAAASSAGHTLRCRVAVHQRAFHRTPRRDRSPPSHRHRRRFLRQRAGRDHQRALQDRVRLRARRHGWDDVDELELATLTGCTGSTSTGSTATATTSHQQSSKQRSTLPNKPPPPGLETKNRASTQPRAVQPIFGVARGGRGLRVAVAVGVVLRRPRNQVTTSLMSTLRSPRSGIQP